MQRVLLSIVLLIIPVGCNLLSTPATPAPEITINVTVNPPPAAQPANEIEPDNVVIEDSSETVTIQSNSISAPPSANQPANVTASCQTPLNWMTYTIQAGDTLFAIAQRSDSSVAELSRVNCLESADTLEVGQVIFVPQAVETSLSARDAIVYWVGSDTRVDNQSIEIGCATYLNPVVTSVAETGDPARDIEAALTALLGQDAQTPLRNLWASRGLTVSNVTVTNGVADIRLNGDMVLVGTCGDADLSTSLMLSILSNADVATMRVTANGVNLAQLFDMSGLSGTDAVFSSGSYTVPAGYR